jgi:Ni,Fe-hydrogenase III component G
VEVNYHFCFDAEHCVVTVKSWAEKPEPHIESITPIIVGAEWIEREINDLIGCTFDNHPRPERLILADDWPEGVHPLSREYE